MDNMLLGMIVAAAGTFLVISILYYVIIIIAYWKLFTKANEAGWKSIIPIYNTYTMYKICWNPMYFWLTLVAAGLNGVFATLSAQSDGGIWGILSMLIALFIAVINIMLYVKMAKAYGKGIGFAVGLILLNPIFILILGLGNSTYVGADQ